MRRSNPLLWVKPLGIWGYGIPALSVAAALTVSRLPAIHLQDAPVSLFFCAVILSAWFGGVGPGLLATVLSALAFNYYFQPPIHSLGPKPDEIPRLVIFIVSALFVGSLSAAQRSAVESLRRARDDLKATVQELQSANTALKAESRERKSTEEALRRSESYLAEAQRLTHTGSWAWRVPGREALHLSEEWYRIYGFDPKDGLQVWEKRLQRMHPEDRGRWLETIDRAIREKSDYEVEQRLLLPDGTVKYTHTIGHPVLNASGDVVQFVGTMIDVTERKRAEETLRRSEGYLAEAQRLSKTGSWAWDPITDKVFYWSDEMFRIFGLDPQQGMPSSETFAQLVHPEDRERLSEQIQKSVSRKTDYLVHHRIVLPDGTVRHIETIGHAVLNAGGEVVECVGTAMDVTDRKRADEERERLREAQADLARVNRVTTMGELTASVAHEVNQPIAAAVTNAKTCLRWLTRDQPDLEEARAAALRIVNDGTRAAEIVKRIRSLFKKGTSEREFVDINEVIQEMVVLLRGEAIRYSILLKTELEANAPQVMADRVQLQQVLMNLVMNGIDAMKDVDGARELAIKSQRAENEVLVSVNDTGVGLPPEQADRIFTAFFTTKPHGTGMGLSISRSIVESHGGRLWAANNSPRGASFCFALPINAEAKE